MFSLFRRNRDAAQAAAEAADPTEEQRLFHHSQVPDAADLSAHLSIGDDGLPVQVDLIDMNIQGAGVRMPFHVAPSEANDQLVELVVAHAQDGWRVTSLARVTRVAKFDEQHVHVGLKFVNLGDLYAQLDDALGRYFNRRGDLRVQPEPSATVGVKISYLHHRLRGIAHDVSRTGVGVRMTLVQAATFKTGEIVQLRLDVPTIKTPLEAPAYVRHGYRINDDVVLGMEFDLEKRCSLRDQQKAFHAYIEANERRMLDLQQKLTRRG
ncbi:MAG: PilZ domain-containing protein [Planctomycetota bacterium]